MGTQEWQQWKRKATVSNNTSAENRLQQRLDVTTRRPSLELQDSYSRLARAHEMYDVVHGAEACGTSSSGEMMVEEGMSGMCSEIEE